ncbi:hypothetical protein Q3G72_028472 [Acer saccharum]|nr:hypothetical protein Q3G72_028472 [Acer saccharum]
MEDMRIIIDKVKSGVEFNMFDRVSLVDMYVKVEELGLALKVFDESPERNKCESILLWNVLINGCCKVEDLGKIVELFEGMPERNSGEYVYNRLQFSYGWYFTFVQGFVYLGLIYRQGSLAFLNYPAQLMFKSTKVLPVMIMGAFIPGLG